MSPAISFCVDAIHTNMCPIFRYTCSTTLKIIFLPDWQLHLTNFMTKSCNPKKTALFKKSLCSQDSLTPRPARPEAGKGWQKGQAKAENDEDGNRHQVPPSKPRRKVKCGKCPACKASDCGNCRACKDKTKFGGPNKLKQGCYEKKCPV